MTDTIFDDDRLDVDRLAIEYTAESFAVAKNLSGVHRHARDQWLRASQSIPYCFDVDPDGHEDRCAWG